MGSKVYLVGAGVGDMGLLTLKAKRILDYADIIVYDRLLDKEIIKQYSEKELYYVGKRAGNHTLSQDDINALIVDKAKSGKKVVRLKGGDPYVFGRGGEEAQWLLSHGLEFETVPGIPSGIAALTYAGIPLTHRDYAMSATFITGHRREGVTSDYRKFALIGGTLVFFMGLSNIENICMDLIDGGMSEDVPVAVIVDGASPRMYTVVGNLSDIAKKTEHMRDASPAIIVVGEVVGLRDELCFFERLPLFGARILITRSRSQASEISERLKALGADVIERPMFDIEQKNIEDLRDEIDGIEAYKYILFTSVNAVKIFMNELLKLRDIRCIGGHRFITVGRKTAECLREYGIVSDFVPTAYDSDVLSCELANVLTKNDAVFWPHSDLSSEKSLHAFANICALTELHVYSNVRTGEKDDVGSLDYAVFSSSSTVRNYVELYGAESLKSLKCIAIGKKTEATLNGYGIDVYAIPQESTFDSIVDLIMEDYANENEKN